jgi:hypothetical protein
VVEKEGDQLVHGGLRSVEKLLPASARGPGSWIWKQVANIAKTQRESRIIFDEASGEAAAVAARFSVGDRGQTLALNAPGRLDSLAGFVTVAGIVTRAFRALALGVVVLTGCGPVEYLSQVSSRAATALAQAERAEADRYAPFEYVKAREYYTKAREEAGESSFQSAVLYGRLAEELANQARSIAREKTGAAPRSSGPQEPGR